MEVITEFIIYNSEWNMRKNKIKNKWIAESSHHQVLIFGDYRKLLKKIAKVMNFNILEG